MSAVMDNDTIVTTPTSFARICNTSAQKMPTAVKIRYPMDPMESRVMGSTSLTLDRDRWRAIPNRAMALVVAALGSGDKARADTLIQAVRDCTKILNRFFGTISAPSLYAAEDGEMIFEWARADRRAILSFSGDGMIAYTMLRDGRFVPGADIRVDDERLDDSIMPLLNYLQ